MSEIIVKMKSDYIKIKGGEYIRDLVRCKDCKWWDNEDDAERCTHKYGDMWAKPDGFCSYGERHESNETGETGLRWVIVCSVCGHVPRVGWRSNFCPNCGFIDTFRKAERGTDNG